MIFRIFHFPMVIIFLLGVLTSCKKNSPDSPTTPPVVIIPPVFNVDGKWECEIEGVGYSGFVDTSFTQIIHPESAHPDTVLDCNGTSYNKKANIHFRIIINRYFHPDGQFTTATDGLLVFDTLSTRFLIATFNSGSKINYHIDTLKSNKLKATFSGTVKLPLDAQLNGGNVYNVTNGKFSCEFGRGNAEPKAFAYQVDTTKFAGYFSTAKIVSNTLIIEGLPYSYYGEQKFRLIIKTGGTVKTGTYLSKKGEVGLEFYQPSLYPHYVSDSFSNVTLNISYVNNNVVVGSFNGTNYTGAPITGGTFICRIQDYMPQTDSEFKWGFSEDENIFRYNIYGGNMLNASKYQVGSRYFLTLNGESDNGSSQFKIVLSSTTPISTGNYQSGVFAKQLDSLYFKSNTKIWNGNSTYLFADNYQTFCKIDTISANYVSGTIGGRINILMSSSGYTSTQMNFGKFRVAF